MPSLYRHLNESSAPARRAAAEQLVYGMARGDSGANEALLDVCRTVISDLGACDSDDPAEFSRWEFTAERSAMLVCQVPRVQGYLGAIARAPQARTIIDAGCGSSALLTLGSAVFHPRAEMLAYEINPGAARCATAVLELFGLAGRASVQTADVTAATPPEADLAITETFAEGLLRERGVEISATLAKAAKEILPAAITLRATNGGNNRYAHWPTATQLDLASHTGKITGEFPSQKGGLRDVRVWAAYFDARGNPVLATGGKDAITRPARLGFIDASRWRTTIGFAYEAGTDPVTDPPLLWSEKTA